MDEPAPTLPVGSIVHHASHSGGECRAALLAGYNEHGSADLVVFSPDGLKFIPAWYGETDNDHGWHLIH